MSSVSQERSSIMYEHHRAVQDVSRFRYSKVYDCSTFHHSRYRFHSSYCVHGDKVRTPVLELRWAVGGRTKTRYSGTAST